MLALLHDEKRFYQAFYALHRDKVLIDVFNKFGIESFRRSSVLEGFDEFLKETKFSGKRCVEIGTCKGITAVVLSRYFDEVVSIDILPDPMKYEIVEYLGIKNIKFYDVKNNAEKAKIINRIEFDAAYSDGDHANDTNEDFDLVKRCGRVLFHEYWEPQPPVVELVDSLKDKGQVQIKDKWALWTA